MKGAKGFGYIYQRPGSPFLWASYPYRGRQIRESTKATTRQGALAFLKARLLEIDSGTYVGRQAEGTTVRDVLADLRRDYEIHKRASFRTITGHIAALNAEIGDERCVNVTLPLLNRLVQEWQAAKRADATSNRLLGTLRHALRLGCDAKKVRHVPKFPHLRENNARQGFCEWATFHVVLAHLPDDGLRDFVEWAARTAMCCGEIRKLTWQGYDRETGVVRLPGKDAKTGKPRRIVLAGPLIALMARRIEARKTHPECALIFHRHGKPVRDFRKAWANACTAAGVTGLRFHDLRRTALRNMVRAGVTQTVAMAISGHRTDTVFRRYDITSDDDLRAAMEKTTTYLDTLPTTPTVAPLRRSA